MLPEAVAAVAAGMAEPGNASSLHSTGRRARRTVEESREAVAAALGARPSEVLFTGGGTESDNLAVKGIFWARRAADPRRTRILASAVEHHAVLDAVEWLVAHEGASVTWLEVDSLGRVHPDVLAAALGDDVALVTVMWANNEVGTIQPIVDLAATAHAAGVPLHTDAVQAVGQLPVDFAASGVDAMTITGHKFGGPLGAGALRARPGRRLHAAAARWRPGARRPLRDVRHPCPRRSRGRDDPGHRAAAGDRRPAHRAARRPRRAGARRHPRRDLQRRPGATGCLATRTSRSRAARATRCCCCSMPRASRSRPVRPARRASHGRPTCSSRWGTTRSRRAARCGSPSATARRPPTSTRCSTPCPRGRAGPPSRAVR